MAVNCRYKFCWQGFVFELYFFLPSYQQCYFMLKNCKSKVRLRLLTIVEKQKLDDALEVENYELCAELKIQIDNFNK